MIKNSIDSAQKYIAQKVYFTKRINYIALKEKNKNERVMQIRKQKNDNWFL